MKEISYKKGLVFMFVGILLTISFASAISSTAEIDKKEIYEETQHIKTGHYFFDQFHNPYQHNARHYTSTTEEDKERFNHKQYYDAMNSQSENSLVCGYITDLDTESPIENAEVNMHWNDNQGNYDSNYTYTNSSGYYSMNVAEGEIDLHIYADGYLNENTEWYHIDEYETIWINISMTPLPPENSIVCGYITDVLTEEPIDDAYISLRWENDQGHYYYNYTYSNSTGFYSLNVAAGEIRVNIYAEGYLDVYGSYFLIDEYETLWLNVSMTPFPPENSIVCGYVIDAETDVPIEDAEVNLHWTDNQGHHDYNYTQTDSLGFYRMNVAAGGINLNVYAAGYFNEYTEYYYIEENKTLWINISMKIDLKEPSIICGYITDEVTKASIKNAYVRIDWRDNQGHYNTNATISNSAGFYKIHVAEGEIQLYIGATAYHDEYSSWYEIAIDETLWYNTSLKPEIEVSITKPVGGLYINNTMIMPKITSILGKLLPTLKPLIIGGIDIEVNVTGSRSGTNRVDFYIDDNLIGTDNSAPYNLTWNNKTFFKHTLKVVAYDNSGPCDIEEIVVRKFF